MERKRLPTAICPNCKDFAFRVYRSIFKRRWHQCCNCQLVFLRELFIFKIVFDDNYDKGELIGNSIGSQTNCSECDHWFEATEKTECPWGVGARPKEEFPKGKKK